MTKPLIELIEKGGDPAKVLIYACGTCRNVRPSAETAEQCCAPYACRKCKVETPRYRLICDACQRAETDHAAAVRTAKAFNAAEKILLSEYKGTWVCTAYFADESDYVEVDDIVDEERPWVWGCTPLPWPLPDMQDVMANLLEDFPEQSMDDIDFPSLQAHVAEWFKQNLPSDSGYVEVNHKVVVVIDPANTPNALKVPE